MLPTDRCRGHLFFHALARLFGVQQILALTLDALSGDFVGFQQLFFRVGHGDGRDVGLIGHGVVLCFGGCKRGYGKFYAIVESILVASFVEIKAIMPTACDRYGHTKTFFYSGLVVLLLEKAVMQLKWDEKLDLGGLKAGRCR